MSIRRSLRLLSVISCVALANTGGAFGQMFSATVDNFVSNQVFSLQTQNIRRAAARDRRAARAEAPAFAADDLALSFSPDRKLRASLTRDLRRQIAGASPEDAQALPRNVFSLARGALGQVGLSVDDLSDTTAAYMVEVYDAARGAGSTLDADAYRTLAAQMDLAYASLAETEAGLRDPELVQTQSDRFVLQAVLIAALAESFAPNGQQAGEAEFRAAMRELGQEVFGIDLTRATIDARGLTPGEALGALGGAVREARDERAAADPEGEAARAVEAALGTPCGRTPQDALQRKVLRVFESRDVCAAFDPERYAAFLREVPREQHYAINFLAFASGKPLYPAAQARTMDAMLD